jgi:beta-phosphoglucomutase
MVQGILFDMDGVIIDTLHYHYLAWKHMFEMRGGKAVSELTVLVHEGRASREILPILMEEARVQVPEEEQSDFIEQKRAYFRTIVRGEFYPKSFETIDELKNRGFKVALVTACALKNMQHSLSSEQQTRFNFIITGDEVKNAKPFPEPYLTAAAKLGIPPQECIVVENAPLGIEAAKNAGMYCAAIETTLGRDYLKMADCILPKITDLLDLPFLKKAAQ